MGIETRTRGTVYFDDFESRRFSYIGTLPDPGVNDPQATNAAGWTASTYQYSASIPHAVTNVTPETGTPDTYSYDANGNMTCRIENGITYTHTYNAENRASSIAKRSGDCATGTILESWSFAYDGDGTRVSTAHFTGVSGTPDSTTSYFMGGAYEVKDGAAKKYYSIAGMMVAVNDGTGLQYLLTDHLGSTVAVTNSSGTLTSQQRYLPFGAPRTIPNSPIAGTDFTYTGQRKLDDGMGGIMDYKARFYSPYLNHFTQPDSIIPDQTNPQSWNRYSYALNNPIRYNDPDGHCPICVIALLVAAAFVMTSSVELPQTYGPPPPSPWGDNKPDATFTSYTVTLSKGLGEKDFWVGGIDIISTKKEVGIFTSTSTLYPFACEDACIVGKPKTSFMIPGISITKTKGAIWGDELGDNVYNYSGGSSVGTGGAGFGPIGIAVEGFASTDPETGKRNDKYLGIGVTSGISVGSPIGLGSYNTWAEPIHKFRKFWVDAE